MNCNVTKKKNDEQDLVDQHFIHYFVYFDKKDLHLQLHFYICKMIITKTPVY